MNVSNIRARAALFIIGLLAAGVAAAVTMSADDSGQVLIYPYYTVNAGQQSTLTLSNTTDQAKAIKLMIRGGAFGRPVYVFNIYLGVHATWTATLGELRSGASTGPALISNHAGCTVPSLHADGLPTLPDGRHYMPPNGASLPADSVADEGYVVAIEMGVLGGDIGEQVGDHTVDHSSVISGPDCSKPMARWQEDGIWRKVASTDISAPTGGLSGTMTILNSSEGTVFRVNATALKDFRVVAMHTAPTATVPDLSDAVSDPDTGMASATIRLGDKTVQSDYPAERAIDAVSAVLMTQQLNTNYDSRAGSGSGTAFVITMPTKRFYVADVNDIIPPFGRDEYHRNSNRGTLCPIINPRGDNKSFYFVGVGRFYVPPEQQDIPLPCYATSVLSLATQKRPSSVLGSKLVSFLTNFPGSLQMGPAFLDMNYYLPYCYATGADDCAYPRSNDYTRAHINIMRPDLEGRQYFGLPVIGFAATGYINAYAGEKNVWRNFTFATPYGRERACVRGGVVGGCN